MPELNIQIVTNVAAVEIGADSIVEIVELGVDSIVEIVELGVVGAQGPAGWNFLGVYNIGASYAIGDVVTYLGQTWYRIHANGGNTGDTPVEGTFWTLIAQKGDPAPEGGDVTGPTTSIDGRVALFDGNTGKLLKQSVAAPVLEGDAIGPFSRNGGISTVGVQLREVSNDTTLLASTGTTGIDTVPTQFAVKSYLQANYSKMFEYEQLIPATTWTINHNLGYKPAVEVFSIGSQELDADVVNASINQTVISFTVATAGFARFN